ncbi:MAG: TonB-dependent receptor [Rikenellaceae bacterium]
MTMLHGVIVSAEDGTVVPFATAFIGDASKYACVSNADGRFRLHIPHGEHDFSVSFIGYETHKQHIVAEGRELKIKIELKPSALAVDEVIVKGEGRSAQINKSAFNVQSIDIGALKNTSASVTDALARMEGVRIREAGGVGSEANISINGFTGSHVKVFIDGVLQNSTNGAFSLNNMPANFAERVEVYSGVVPIEFGTDAIGGVINVVTKKNMALNSYHIDASYSYGSFNTHRTYLNFSRTHKNGFNYSANVYQNYSDNNYEIENTLMTFLPVDLGLGMPPVVDLSDKTLYTFERFHDTYHNETAIVSLGVVGKSWADNINASLNYSQFDKDIQTGATQDVVYGERKRTGRSLTPAFEYLNNGIVKGLDLRTNLNYKYEYTHIYDPSTAVYNWAGESAGDNLTAVDTEMLQYNLNANGVAKYRLGKSHDFTLSYTFASSSRQSRSVEEGQDDYSDYSTPLMSRSNVLGLSYLFKLKSFMEATAFVKGFMLSGEGLVWDSDTSANVYQTRSDSSMGYGAATSFFFLNGFQTKLSYEMAYRLPTTSELFGDGDLEQGNFDLDPESSDNFNLNLSYSREFANKHNITLDGGLIYRYTKDFIQKEVSSGTSATTGDSYSVTTNFGKVETKGYTLTARYSFKNLISVGATYNNISSRDDEEYLSSSLMQKSTSYGVRLPNRPYKYANADGVLTLDNLFMKRDSFSIVYDLFYQHEFTLDFETYGTAGNVACVPNQLSHSLTFNYAIKNGMYNISFECRNLTNENLYDNYSLQKAGRAYYAKIRVNINKSK